MSTKIAEGFTLSQLYNQLTSNGGNLSQQELADHLQILSSSLSDGRKLKMESGDSEYIQKLIVWVSKVVLPDGSTVSHDELAEEEVPISVQAAISLSQQKAALGLRGLSSLYHIHENATDQPPPPSLDPQVLLSLITFTNARDPWTTSTILKEAQELLSHYHEQSHTSEFIIDYLLQSFIRPLFSKSKPSAITSTGRRAMPTSAPPRKHDIGDLDRSSKPWKYGVVYSITVLGWAVEIASKEIIAHSWNLFIPPLLTLLDDTSTTVRSRGLLILASFLPKLTSKLLSQTGLGEVFEDAITPTLLYVPSITPLDESITLLPAAYEALFVLANVRFQESDDEEKAEKERIKLFDKIMRKGVLAAYLHANEHPPLVEILLLQIKTLVQKQGIHSIKHLKDILPIISAVLTDPFSPSRPSLLLAAIKALQTVILNAWPRMVEKGHRMEIVKALVLCWRNIDEGGGSKGWDEKAFSEIRDELKVTGKLLVRAVEGDVDVKSELEPLVKADEGIRELFGIEITRDD